MNKAFAWEIRVLYLVPAGLVVYFISLPAAYVFIGVAAVGVLATDGLFSIVVAKAFLRPILQALHPAHGQPRSEAARLILRTKWTTFAGVTLAVLSSSLLYLNGVLWTAVPATFGPSAWLNPLVFMVNVDSVLNDVSMLLVSGLLQNCLRRGGVGISPNGSCRSADLSNAINVARSQLEQASAIPNNTGVFLAPQAQARSLLLAKVAHALMKELFHEHGNSSLKGAVRMMDNAIAEVIEQDFVATARAFFNDCVEDSRQLVPMMRTTYHGVRHGHLMIYKDTLGTIRMDASFPELQQRAEELVLKCAQLDRPRQQSSTTITGLYRNGEAVSKMYDKLMISIASVAGAKFHKVTMKGLMRMVEKLALTSGDKNWKPEFLCDVVRGALECKDFTTMITTVRLLRDLDEHLLITGQTGGIKQRICICRAKNRFGNPTSGGWADFMVNFYFEEDGHKHICEVQLVHSQMFLMRQTMGAHATYGQFRGAKEILEILGLDPEEGADATAVRILRELVWTGQPVQRELAGTLHGSSSVAATTEVVALQAELRTLNARMDASMDAQAETLATLQAQNTLLLAQFDEGNADRAPTSKSQAKAAGRRLPAFASLRKKKDKAQNPSVLGHTDDGVTSLPKAENKRKVFKMPSIDRNPESLNDNYTAPGRLKSSKLTAPRKTSEVGGGQDLQVLDELSWK
jgi:hypothetical protein